MNKLIIPPVYEDIATLAKEYCPSGSVTGADDLDIQIAFEQGFREG